MPTGAQGGKKKPLKQEKKNTILTDEDIEFKKKEIEQRKKDETARKDLLAKKNAKKK
ncbi:hypothetical protein BMR1_02g01725 [Babesia microti strain RI]|uniref:Translation machinery associated TMA7 n=1 Tax=Babesia microti (strain RI) TaxID=1133968 RepID=I7J9Y1_BABMR|nr:hypothetical protein BMR1_02g01725 [Babesia microti strain RI]CCF73504.1 hypothetical protein BMR1_02g01725 [Babesia microti strain RI]|eukprot:XP_012648113.1 hypothetical protein BMR1_02g01725 [Babesia microti strain RI]